MGKELTIGSAKIVCMSTGVVIAHERTAMVADVQPLAGATGWIPEPLSSPEGLSASRGSDLF